MAPKNTPINRPIAAPPNKPIADLMPQLSVMNEKSGGGSCAPLNVGIQGIKYGNLVVLK
eukprot:CAMPEP_0116031688 /NCGR_PEP_ID=MMETSP0321-20121206/17708_1 /TAXON_ID=163516 /ORGANISM="Leptocylindrus danicus var. danicus, Strain B650" /LENGTH=58 /DNA_ID=CAMNT_0003506951 /DNA_START=592 /DNA_END=768 /DNA_ORIENTATION=-